MTELASRFLFTLAVQVGAGYEIEAADITGKSSIWPFEGGRFSGPLLTGDVLAVGGDWASVVHPDLVRIDVATILRTHDQATISFRYKGLWRAAPGALAKVMQPSGDKLFDPTEHYLRVIGSFETAAPSYAWLNTIIAIGFGEKTSGGIRYEFYEVL